MKWIRYNGDEVCIEYKSNQSISYLLIMKNDSPIARDEVTVDDDYLKEQKSWAIALWLNKIIPYRRVKSYDWSNTLITSISYFLFKPYLTINQESHKGTNSFPSPALVLQQHDHQQKPAYIP